MNIVILDYKTLGDDLDLSGAEKFGTVIKYPSSTQDEAKERVRDADIIIVNKVKMTEDVVKNAPNLKLICETATGYDNIDIAYCTSRGIKVANTPAYSTSCVAQVTVSMACSLITHLNEYRQFVHNGQYQKSISANRLEPIYHELEGMTWGIIGFGNIGRKVATVAKALGCNILVNKRTPVSDFKRVDLETILKNSDIISIHCPLSNETRGMIGKKELDMMKGNAVIINVARGAIWDEGAVADAILDGTIGGMACDVFSQEPLPSEHPFNKILDKENVILTPHMAWGSFESRTRCFNTVLSNIEAFLDGREQNLVR
ncbi:MAG: hydroxyacid dehydrogenase [Clostridia bacterium]|nr:hydroxyacid dehydrogenase [Clostridia bacterium]